MDKRSLESLEKEVRIFKALVSKLWFEISRQANVKLRVKEGLKRESNVVELRYNRGSMEINRGLERRMHKLI